MNQKYIQRKNSTIHTYNNLTLTNKLDDTLTFQYDFISFFFAFRRSLLWTFSFYDWTAKTNTVKFVEYLTKSKKRNCVIVEKEEEGWISELTL